MQTIDARELHEQTRDVLRRVCEEGETFEVMDDGRVVAHLIPAHHQETPTLSLDEWWERHNRLAEKISAQWIGDVDCVEAVREQRRDL